MLERIAGKMLTIGIMPSTAATSLTIAPEGTDAATPLPRTARLTVANILANPLRMLAPLIAAHTRAGGAIALSGILEEQHREVIEAYAPWAALEAVQRESGWVLLAGARNA